VELIHACLLEHIHARFNASDQERGRVGDAVALDAWTDVKFIVHLESSLQFVTPPT